MSPVHLLPREEVVAGLKKEGNCRFVAPIDDTHELWATDWGMHFILPAVGPDKMCPKIAYFGILTDIARTRPSK